MSHMKNPKGEQPKQPSDAEFDAALHAALRDTNRLFPSSAEEVAVLKAHLDMNGVPTPDTQRFRELLRNKAQKIVGLPGTARCTSTDVEQDLERLAIAARNGGEITKEIRQRMDADRAQAAEQVRNENAPH